MWRRAAAAGIVLCCGLRAAELRGIQPRERRSDYFVTSFTESLAVAATLVTPDQARRLFGDRATDRVLAVEVGFYSKNFDVYEVRRSDFALRLRPSGLVVRGIDPKSLAVESLSRKSLPEGLTRRAVAGYLLFADPGHWDEELELEYRGNGVWLTLPIRYRR